MKIISLHLKCRRVKSTVAPLVDFRKIIAIRNYCAVFIFTNQRNFIVPRRDEHLFMILSILNKNADTVNRKRFAGFNCSLNGGKITASVFGYYKVIFIRNFLVRKSKR